MNCIENTEFYKFIDLYSYVFTGENACNQHFFLSISCFLPFQAKFHLFSHTLFCVYGCWQFRVVKKVNSLLNNTFLHLSKMKAFAEDKINMTQKLKFFLGKIENIVGNGENAGYQHFLLFPQCFQRLLFQGR